LCRLCKTTATVETLHNALDRNPLDPNAARLVQQVTALNASINSLCRALRLGPLAEISVRSTGHLAEAGLGALAADPLIGGRAVRRDADR
jgi:hypothetical protein